MVLDCRTISDPLSRLFKTQLNLDSVVSRYCHKIANFKKNIFYPTVATAKPQTPLWPELVYIDWSNERGQS